VPGSAPEITELPQVATQVATQVARSKPIENGAEWSQILTN
jgi:hypothetical protein